MTNNEVIKNCNQYIGQLNGLITSEQYDELLRMCLSDLTVRIFFKLVLL